MARIMIADDNPSVRFLISALVTQAGHEVVLQAENGLEALNAYFEANPDLLIVDYQMPILDGISVINAITRDAPDARVLMCTGSIDKVKCDLMMNKDITVISKPFDIDEFIQVLKKTLTN